MNKKIFTLDDIEKCLNELGFEWVDRYILIGKNYRYATLSNFTGKPVTLYLKRNQYVLTSVTASNNTFIISRDNERCDATSIWLDILNEKNIQV